MAASRRSHRSVAFLVETSALGGAEVYIGHLLRHLPPELPRVLFVRAPAPSRLIEGAEEAGVEVVLWRATLGGLARLRRRLQVAGIVHVNLTAPGHNRHALIAAWLCRGPVVASLHLYLEPRSTLRRQLLHLAYRRFARVIAVSADIEQALICRLGVRRERVRLVPNAVEPATVSLATSTASAERGATVTIGGMGRLTPQKGFDLLMDATRRLVTHGHPIEVLIAGDGPDRAALERAARDLPVRFLGTVDDTAGFLQQLDVFCLPSRWEGLPFALLEAMMLGRACVAAAVGDVPLALGHAGIVVPREDGDALVDALETLITSTDDRQALGKAARRRAQDHYTIDRLVQRTLAVYAELGVHHPGA